MFTSSNPNLKKYMFCVENNINWYTSMKLVKSHVFYPAVYDRKILKILYKTNLIGFHLYNDRWVAHVNYKKFARYPIKLLIRLINKFTSVKISLEIEQEFKKFGIKLWLDSHAIEHDQFLKDFIRKQKVKNYANRKY